MNRSSIPRVLLGAGLLLCSAQIVAAGNSCSHDPGTFADYDATPGGVGTELLSMGSSGVTVKTLAKTLHKRPIVAVRVGPSNSAVPTVYVLGEHHGSEWEAEEIPLRLLRWARDSVHGKGDRGLQRGLEHVALVFVPVVNPDGYQYHHASGEGTRKNRDPNPPCAVAAGSGVDINRNYPLDWNEPPSDIDHSNPCSPTYNGPTASSEVETKAIEALLEGKAFIDSRHPAQKPVAAVAYHSAADSLIYPPGYKAHTNGSGPRCAPADNCFNPDKPLYRRLFGDLENPIVFDKTLSPAYPLPRSQQGNVSYPTAGDMTAFANFGAPRIVALTVELGSAGDCSLGTETVLAKELTQQQALLKALVQHARALGSTQASSSFAPRELGILTGGFWAREPSGSATTATARPRFLVSSWKHGYSSSTLTATVDDTAVPFHPARSGAQYKAWYVDSSETGDPFCLPCELSFRADGAKGAGFRSSCTPGACIDLTDPDRFPSHAGWTLKTGSRGGSTDYWWQADATNVEAVLEIPAWTTPADVTSCHLSFTFDANVSRQTSVFLERLDGASWRVVLQWPFPAPIGSDSFAAFASEQAEANSLLPSSTGAFRFRVPLGEGRPDFKLFDPVITCREGPLP